MTAAVLVLDPIFEADLQPEQYAYRRDRSALDAVSQVHRLINRGHVEVVDADLTGYFDTLPHAELLKSVARRGVDRAMLHLIKMGLKAPVEATDERGKKHRNTRNRDEGRGSPQGSPISPLLSNFYMRRFVLGWKLGHERRLGIPLVDLSIRVGQLFKACMLTRRILCSSSAIECRACLIAPSYRAISLIIPLC
jgi:RNA-directed DNA polymerase